MHFRVMAAMTIGNIKVGILIYIEPPLACEILQDMSLDVYDYVNELATGIIHM